jgi:hypothetical protein
MGLAMQLQPQDLHPPPYGQIWVAMSLIGDCPTLFLRKLKSAHP